MNIVLLESLNVERPVMDAFKAQLEELGHTFTEYEKTSDVAALIEEAKDADAIMLANMPLPAEVVEAAPRLKYIDVAFTGYDHIPMAVCVAKNIAVSNASGYATESVAELAIASMILLARKVPALEIAVKDGKTKAGLRGWTLDGRTVGIVGAGAIGLRTAELAKAMGARIIAFNRSKVTSPIVDEQVSLEELMKQSDVVSVHLPLSDSTRGIVSKELLETMKPTAVLINTARGPVVDENALADLLNAGKIQGAAVDVFAKEPPLALDNPLLHTPNTIVTPHIGFDSEQSMVLRANIVFDNLLSWLKGEIKNEVKAR